MSKDKSEDKGSHWKKKSQRQSLEIRRLNSRNKELTASRDKWKKKCQWLKNCQGLVPKSGALGYGSARGHQYALWVVEYCIRMCCYGGTSLRCCREGLRCLVLVLGLELRVPSHTSIRNWQLKLGWLRHHEGPPLSLGGRWAVIADESVAFGTERLLVVLGLDLSVWRFDRSPALSDVRVLYMGSSSEWKSPAVSAALKQATGGLEVVQAVSDGGNNLLRAFELCSFLHVPDCSHAVANILERHLDKDENFKCLGVLAGQLRQCWATSQHTAWCPPQKRGKSRFLNVFALFEWAGKILRNADKLPQAVREKTEWLFENAGFVGELCQIARIVKSLFALLKSKGACARSLEKAQQLIKGHQPDRPVGRICQDIQKYLDVLAAKSLGHDKSLLCCSDIIESLFGRFKYRAKLNQGVTDTALTIHLLNGKLDARTLKTALESVQLDQIKNWKIVKKNEG